MRKIKLALYVLALSTSSACVMADDKPTPVTQGTVTFNGKLISETCSIASDSKALIITLPTISTQSLNAPGAAAGSKGFDINVEQCPEAIKKVAAHFEGIGSSGSDTTTGNLTNGFPTETERADKVQVRLYDSNEKQLKLGDTGSPYAVTDGKATLRYFGGYYATGATTAGNFQAKVMYTLAYP